MIWDLFPCSIHSGLWTDGIGRRDNSEREQEMNARNDIDSRIHRICMLSRTSEEEMYVLGKSLLVLFRDVFKSTRLDADDMVDKLCSDSEEIEEDKRMQEALTRLEFFATESVRNRYESEIDSILQTGWLLRIMEALKTKVYNFPDYGPDFVSILTLTYLNTFKYTIEEIEEATCLSKATIYRHKKRAIIVFGLAFLEYKQDFRRPDPHTFGFTGEQLQFDFYKPALRVI